MVTVTSLGNAGFRIRHGARSLVFDPFDGGFAGADGDCMIDAILITHDHWDHFSPGEIAAEAERTGAIVCAPGSAAAKLRGRMDVSRLAVMDPAVSKAGAGSGATRAIGEITVTAFGTAHGRAHNSYLVEMPGLRVFHDGDNERTELLDRGKLAGLDLLMLCPWQGSGWVEFIEEIRPRFWFLMHMTEAELAQHERGEFFPGICDRLPQEPIALHPGESRAVPPLKQC